VSRFSAKVILFCGAVGICVSAILLYTVPNQYVVLFAFILMGAAIAGTQPTAISIGVRLHPTKSAALSSGIMALGELGFIISTPLTGWIADMHGMSVAMALALPCGIAMIIAVLLVPRSTS
jgi:fucose permease